MSWSEIKKAINSTIGTSSAKPLNEIILGGVSTVRKIQRGVANGNQSITLNGFSNSNKMVAFVTGSMNSAESALATGAGGNYSWGTGSVHSFNSNNPYVSSLSASTLSVAGASGGSSKTMTWYSAKGGDVTGTVGSTYTTTYSYAVIEFY